MQPIPEIRDDVMRTPLDCERKGSHTSYRQLNDLTSLDSAINALKVVFSLHALN